MEHSISTKNSVKKIVLYLILSLVVCILLGGMVIYEGRRISLLTKKIDAVTLELASTTRTLSFNINQLSGNLVNLNKQTAGISVGLTKNEQNIDVMKTQVGGVEQSVGSISSTVGTLQKLSQVDPQLLKKYSKVYFMNDNYIPAHLTDVRSQYIYSTNRNEQFLTESWPYLKNLFDAAKVDGITLYVKSGYRSFAEQKSLKSSYTITYGAGTANSFSADQGYSEHQLGSTLDFITTGLDGNLHEFDTTQAYQWLLTNGYRYGFVLSYQKGNKYYIYEPWHWRFVGVKLSTYLHDNNLHFYDMDQRQIDTYLINLFD